MIFKDVGFGMCYIMYFMSNSIYNEILVFTSAYWRPDLIIAS